MEVQKQTNIAGENDKSTPVGEEPTVEESLGNMSKVELEAQIQLYHDRGAGDQISQIFFDMLARFD